MNSVLLLTRLQIQQSLGGLRAAIQKRASSHGAMVVTVLIALLTLGGIAWLGFSAYGIVGNAGIDKTVFDILFTLCGVLTFTFSLPSVLDSFFGSSNINDLLPLPVSPFSIVLSKALGALAASYIWTFLLIAAPLLGWGIASGAGVHYWMAYLLAVICAPLMPTAYSGTLSILVATAFKRLRRKDAITTLTTILSLAISVGIFFLSRNQQLSEDAVRALSGVTDLMGSVVMAFPAYGFAVYALSNPDPMGCLMLVLISLAAFAVFVIVARLLYLRIVTALSTGGARAQAYDGMASQQKSSQLISLLRTEVRKIVRNSSVLLNFVVYPLVVVPVIFIVSFTTGSSSLSDLRETFAEVDDVTAMVSGFGLCLVAFVAGICGLSNKLASTCISREGSNWVHMKFIPVPLYTQILAKMLPGVFVSGVIAIVFMALGGYFLVGQAGIEVLVYACGCVYILAMTWLMSCVAAWADSCAPNVSWGNDGDVNPKTIKGNAGLLRAFVVVIVYSLLLLLPTPITGLDPRMLMPVIAIVGTVVSVVLGKRLLVAAARNVESFE